VRLGFLNKWLILTRGSTSIEPNPTGTRGLDRPVSRLRQARPGLGHEAERDVPGDALLPGMPAGVHVVGSEIREVAIRSVGI